MTQCQVFSAFALVATAGAALASQVHFNDVTLADLIARSELVVVADRVGPADRPARFRIVEVLSAKAAPPAAATILTVYPADQELNAAMSEHIAKHGYQGLPSPIVDHYPSSLTDEKFAKGKRMILFLRKWKKDWQLALEGGFEAPGKKEAVAAALRR